FHRGRPAHLAGADALHDSRRVPVHGTARSVARPRPQGEAGGADAGRGARVMNVSAPFIRRPVATTLLAIAVVLAGSAAYTQLPVAPLPRVDNPTINANARLPGGSPESMASALATPLQRRFGRIAGVPEVTSASPR